MAVFTCTKPQRLPRYRRIISILKCINEVGRYNDLTMTKIAFWQGLQPSSHLLNILKGMEEHGLLTSEPEPYRPGIEKRNWKITPYGERNLKEAGGWEDIPF